MKHFNIVEEYGFKKRTKSRIAMKFSVELPPHLKIEHKQTYVMLKYGHQDSSLFAGVKLARKHTAEEFEMQGKCQSSHSGSGLPSGGSQTVPS